MSGSKITPTLTKKNYASQGRRGLAQLDRAGLCWMLDILEWADKIEHQWILQCILA
jgi:hypothetical protein